MERKRLLPLRTEESPTPPSPIGWDKSRVTYEIEPLEDMVCLTVTHDNFKAGSKMVGKVSGGWPRVLSSLKSFLETGKGLNVFAGCKD